tara:strand:+ start:1226 stop:2323 length:1098 start_codon:yes stop_codon:yes gene_type:complete
MSVFQEMVGRNHEQVSYFYDEHTGLKCIISVHNTILGPGLGGCRVWNYKNEQEALIDVLRLSRGMTYKAAIAGLNLGGAKAVILSKDNTVKNEAYFRSFGRFVEAMGGRYITAEDVGTSVRDMEWVRSETDYVVGISRSLGGSGDPSVVTAYGVYIGIKACAKEKFNQNDLDGLKIAIQGLGHVGMYLVEYLSKHDVEIYVTDINENLVQQAVSKFDVNPVSTDEILKLNVDILAPCALGAVINDETIPQLNCKVVAGGANNVLKNAKIDGEMLKKRDILYAPDYAINAGGLINVANELEGYNRQRAFDQAEGIYDILRDIFRRSKNDDITTNEASDLQAEDRIMKMARLKTFYNRKKKSVFKIK